MSTIMLDAMAMAVIAGLVSLIYIAILSALQGPLG